MTEQEIWLKAWCASISSSLDADATIAADECLKAYKERFTEPEAKVNRREVNRELFQAAEQALMQLIWCSGANDFAEGGIAHEAFVRKTRPTIDRLREVLKRVSIVYVQKLDEYSEPIGEPVFGGGLNFTTQAAHHP